MATATQTIKGTADFANDFVPVFKQAASTAEKEKTRLLGKLAQIREEQKELHDNETRIQKAIAELDANILVGLKIAAKEAGVKLDVSIDRPKPNGSERKTRMSRADLGRAASKILGVMPRNKTRRFDQIHRDTGLEIKVCRSVLQKLKREGKVKSNGKKGPASGWQRA